MGASNSPWHHGDFNHPPMGRSRGRQGAHHLWFVGVWFVWKWGGCPGILGKLMIEQWIGMRFRFSVKPKLFFFIVVVVVVVVVVLVHPSGLVDEHGLPPTYSGLSHQQNQRQLAGGAGEGCGLVWPTDFAHCRPPNRQCCHETLQHGAPIWVSLKMV